MSTDYMNEAMEEIEAGLNLVSQDEFQGILQAVAKTASTVVAKTLGPYARTTIIDDGSYSYPTKDGWMVLSRLKFADPVHQAIYRTFQQIPFRIVDKVGDGTSTATVVAQHFIELITSGQHTVHYQGRDWGLKDLRQADVVDALKHVQIDVVRELEKMAIPITDDEDYKGIHRVAYISSNGNLALADIMRDIYRETNNPNVLVDMAGGEQGVSYEIQEGYRLDCKVLMKQRYVNTSEGNYITDGKLHQFVIFDHNVTYNQHGKLINDLLHHCNSMAVNRQEEVVLVMFAPHYDDLTASSISASVDAMLRQNPNAIPNIMLVQVPEMSRYQTQCYVHDFAAIAGVAVTNATKVKVYNQMKYNASIEGKEGEDPIHIKEMDLDDYNFKSIVALLESCMGGVRLATFTSKAVTLHKIDPSNVRYKEALEMARQDLETATKESKANGTTMMKSYMEATDRMNRLSGKIGVIHVGGSSELERSCMMDVVDDVFRACRSAYENGVVSGMNMGTMVALNRQLNSRKLMADETGKFPHNRMIEVVLKTLSDAYRLTIFDLLANKKPDANALWDYGIEHINRETLVNYLVQDVDRGSVGSYDIVTEHFYTKDMLQVINSVDTDIEILNGVIGILSLLLTSDQYLSVSRFYDKRVAAKQQELANGRDLTMRVETIMAGIRGYLMTYPGQNMLRELRAVFNDHALMTDRKMQDPPYDSSGTSTCGSGTSDVKI